MRKIILIFCVLFFNIIKSYSNILVYLYCEYKSQHGHVIEMFYTVNSIEDLGISLSGLKKINERDLLSSIGLPIIDSGKGESICNLLDTVKFNKLIVKNTKQNIKLSNSEFIINLSLVKAQYDVCIFKSSLKYWSSYDVHFDSVATITSKIRIERFTKDEIKSIKSIKINSDFGRRKDP